MQIAIVIDTYPMNPKIQEFCRRIVDTGPDAKRVYAYGFRKTLPECFEEAHKSFQNIEQRLKAPRTTSIWYAGCELNKEENEKS